MKKCRVPSLRGVDLTSGTCVHVYVISANYINIYYIVMNLVRCVTAGRIRNLLQHSSSLTKSRTHTGAHGEVFFSQMYALLSGPMRRNACDERRRAWLLPVLPALDKIYIVFSISKTVQIPIAQCGS